MGIKDKIAEVNIVNFAAAVAIVMLIALASVHVAMAAQAEDRLEAFKDVVLWVLPVLLNILATYGIITKES